MTSINGNYNSNSYYYYPNTDENNDNKRYRYQQRNPMNAEIGWLLASSATALIYKLLPSFSNPFLKQMPKEHLNNHLYHDVFMKAFKESGLEGKGLKLINVTDPTTDVGKGLNAFFAPAEKVIAFNHDKASISGFHELGHAMNNMNKGIGKLLQKLRKPGYTIAGLMGTVALFSRNKPKGEKREPIDVVVDNAHVIASVGMLPTVLEESLASYKGIKAAKKAGLSAPLIKNLRKFYGKALLSYAGYAFVTGLSVYAAGKIMDKFTRPKIVEY